MNFSLLLLFALLKEDPKPVTMKPSPVNKDLLLKLVNDARKKGRYCGDTYYAAAAPLVWNDMLEKAALDHSEDMQSKNYFSHKDKQGNGAQTRIKNAGYNWTTYGENIAQGYTTEKDVIEGWLSSTGHCANIMTKGFVEMGVGKSGNYWTQTFGAK